MDGRSFLGTARLLLSDGGNEAAYRSAISRAYYACFLATREIAFRCCDPVVRQTGSFRREKDINHSYLKNCCLRPEAGSAIPQLGKDLDHLRGSREDADYEMSLSISSREAKQAIEEAEALLEELGSICPDEIGKALEEHIKATCRKRT